VAGAGGRSGVGGASATGGTTGEGGKVGTGGMGAGGMGMGGKAVGGSGAGGSGMGGSGVGGAAGDPCLNNGGCAVTATCFRNLNGTRTCACNSGYAGDGITCADVNECLSSNGLCDANATCTNTIGSRTCACKTGFTGDGVSCADVNECLSNNGGCSANANCTNTVGGRTCTCAVGYTGNGTTCTVIPPPAPISTWKFERQSTPTLILDSTGTNNGTLASLSFLPPVTSTMPLYAPDRNGVANGALHLDLATNANWVFVPSSTSVNTPWANGAITVTVWVRMNSVPASGGVGLFDRGGASDATGLSVELFNGTAMAFLANLGSAQSTIPMPVGVWTFLAATYNGTDLFLYQNGVLVASFPGIAKPLVSGTADVALGGEINKAGGYSTGFLSGDLDEIRLYAAALSAPQINLVMQQ
jgi:hypothetical protein